MTPESPTTLESAPAARRAPVFKVVAVGGAGLQAAAHMARSDLADVNFAGVHTDARLLSQSTLAQKLLLGTSLTRGLGAGGDPDIGEAAAEADAPALRGLCQGADLVVVVAGLGGGTGSGTAPVVARLARESGALVLALVALPFDFEGTRRQQQAQLALRQLKTACDAVICLPNQKVSRLIDANTSLVETFHITNDMLTEGLRGLWRLITREGLISVDFADLCRVVRGRQAESCFATAEAMGDNRSREVIEQLTSSPLLDHGQLLAAADAVLVSLVGGTDLSLKEVTQVMEQINRLCDHAQVIMGAAVDPAFGDRLAVTLVATRRNDPPADKPDRPGTEAASNLFPADPTAADRGADGLLSPRSATARPTSRFVAPAPELTPAEAQEVLARQGRLSARRRKKGALMRQELLPLEVVSKGRFAKSEPTIHEGEDLDTPTYIRRGMALN